MEQRRAISPKTGYNNNRKSGYYWVLWAVIDGRKWNRVAYYNEGLHGWLLPGEERIYFDQDIVTVYETPIDKPMRFDRIYDIALKAWLWMLVIYLAVKAAIEITNYIKLTTK